MSGWIELTRKHSAYEQMVRFVGNVTEWRHRVKGQRGIWTLGPAPDMVKQAMEPDKKLSDMSEEELIAEHRKWCDALSDGKRESWGAAVAAANEFRIDAEREMRRRGIRVTGR